MPVYIWKGKNSYGEKRKGEIEAPDQTAALAQVKRLRISDPLLPPFQNCKNGKMIRADVSESITRNQFEIFGIDRIINR